MLRVDTHGSRRPGTHIACRTTHESGLANSRDHRLKKKYGRGLRFDYMGTWNNLLCKPPTADVLRAAVLLRHRHGTKTVNGFPQEHAELCGVSACRT